MGVVQSKLRDPRSVPRPFARIIRQTAPGTQAIRRDVRRSTKQSLAILVRQSAQCCCDRRVTPTATALGPPLGACARFPGPRCLVRGGLLQSTRRPSPPLRQRRTESRAASIPRRARRAAGIRVGAARARRRAPRFRHPHFARDPLGHPLRGAAPAARPGSRNYRLASASPRSSGRWSRRGSTRIPAPSSGSCAKYCRRSARSTRAACASPAG